MVLKRTVLLGSLLLLLCAQTVFCQGYKLKKIVIDAGHGGNKPGAAGSFSSEKNIALQVALKLGRKLESELPGVKILYTRKSDIDVSLYKRAEIANAAKADLFISIHCNSMPDRRVSAGHTTKRGKKIPKYTYTKDRTTRGTETFVAGSHRLHEQDGAIRENADIRLEKDYKKHYDGYDPKDPETFIILSLFKNI